MGRSRSGANQALEYLVARGFLNKNEAVRYRPWTVSALGLLVLDHAAKGERPVASTKQTRAA